MRVSSMIDAHKLLKDVIESHDDARKWIGSPFEHIKRISNSKVGAVGQSFVEKLCEVIGFDHEPFRNQKGKRTTTGDWDIEIEGVSFEVKTATEDTVGNFQFNHIRHHRQYDAVLCIGIAPDDIFFGAWSKADIATGKAGHLVSMDKGSSATFKLTKGRDDLKPIGEFEDSMLDLAAELG